MVFSIKAVVTTRHQRSANPTSEWARRRRQRQRAETRTDATPPTQTPRNGTSPPPPPADQQRDPPPGHRASGWRRYAAISAKIQRFYRANPSACVRQILSEGPPLYCKVDEGEIVAHFSTAYAASPPLNPTPEWLFPPRETEDVNRGDVFPGSTWCRKLDTTLRGAFKQGLKLPRRTATQYFYLPQALGGLGIPSVEDEAHIARAAQAFKFLGDTRDSVIREVALQQLSETVTKRARRLDPNKLEDLAEFLNTSAAPGEGRAGDLQSLWSSARASLVAGGAAIEITQDLAILHTSKHNIPWHKRKQAFQAMEEVGQRHLRNIKRSSDQGRAFDSLSLHPDSTFFTYTGAFLSFYQYRFIHKARLNLLPVRTVQARCHRPVPSTLCRHCGRDQETLAQFLNHCHQNLGMVWDRHNSVLERIVRAVPEHLGTKQKEQPIPGTSGANRPDLTIISPDKSTIISW